MTPMTMHPAFQRLFAEHTAPSHCDRAKASAGLAPVAELVADIQKQLIVYRKLTRAVQLATDADGLEWKAEHIDQTFKALQTKVAALDELAHGVAHDMRQLDRYLASAKVDVATIEENQGKTETLTLARRAPAVDPAPAGGATDA